jgi:hypothetical protein
MPFGLVFRGRTGLGVDISQAFRERLRLCLRGKLPDDVPPRQGIDCRGLEASWAVMGDFVCDHEFDSVEWVNEIAAPHGAKHTGPPRSPLAARWEGRDDPLPATGSGTIGASVARDRDGGIRGATKRGPAPLCGASCCYEL